MRAVQKVNWSEQVWFRELKLPTCVPLDRLNTFLAMYRVHHQHLHQAIVRSWISKLFVFMILTWSIIEFDHFFQETLFIFPVTNIVLRFSFSNLTLLITTVFSQPLQRIFGDYPSDQPGPLSCLSPIMFFQILFFWRDLSDRPLLGLGSSTTLFFIFFRFGLHCIEIGTLI